MLTNPSSMDISVTAYNATFQAPWIGKVEPEDAGKWVDDFLVLVSNCTTFTPHLINMCVIFL